MSNENSGVKVAVRVRKLISREVKASETIKWNIHEQSIWESGRKDSPYTFDKILGEQVSNEETYEELARDLVLSAMEGMNATIFAYGQTSSGKTHTMMGSKEDKGVIPRAVQDIFRYCADHSEDRSFLLRVSYMEIYNETITDLLNPEKKEKLRVRENIRGEIYVKDLAEVLVTCEEDIKGYLDSGELSRHFAATNMNERSSRSHTIFRLVIESTEKGNEAEVEGQARTVRVSQLNLVDLAGSERAKATGAEGIRLKEGGHINTSLMVLSKVIAKLSEPNLNVNVIPFRESKLTRILQSSLGGNAKTCVICTMTPAAIDESHSTLRFAKSAKMMKNKPIINEVMNDKAIISKYEKRIRKLEQELEEKNQLESHIKLKDSEIMALKGQLVGSARSAPGTPSQKTRRRETFFHGPQGLVPSPRNTFIKSRLTNESDKGDICARKLFNLPAMVSDRGSRDTSIDERELMEMENSKLKSSLDHEQARNARLKNELRELEEMCTEMGDRMQDRIDEQQEQIDQLSNQVEESETFGHHQKNKIQELETILVAAGEERQDLLNEVEDKRAKIRQLEERNLLILNEAEEQRQDLENQITKLTSETGLIASPGKKRKSSQSSIGFDLEALENIKSDVDSKTAEIARLESLLRGSALETEEKLAALQRKHEEETKRVQESQQQIASHHEMKISQMEEEIRSLEEASRQKNDEFSQLQRLVQEQTDLVEAAAQQEITELKTALEDSNTERLNASAEVESLRQDHSELLLKFQQTQENLETLRVEKQYEKDESPMDSTSELDQLKQQLTAKEEEISNLREHKEVDDEMREKLEQRDNMIANLKSQIEKTFGSEEEFKRSQSELNERISKLLHDIEQKSTELNEAEDKLMHLQLASVDTKLLIEQLNSDKSLMAKRNRELSDQNLQLTQTICNMEQEKVDVEENNTSPCKRRLTEDERESLQTEISRLTAKINSMQAEFEGLSDQIIAKHQLKQENEPTESNVEGVDPVAANQDSVDNLKRDIRDLQESREETYQQLKLLMVSKQDLEDKLKMSENQAIKIADLENQLSVANGEVTRLSDLVTNLSEQSSRLSEENLATSSDITATLASSQEQVSEIQDLKKQIAQLNDGMETAEKERAKVIYELQEQLSVANGEVTRLSSLVTKLTEENARLAEEKAVSSSEVSASMSTVTPKEEDTETVIKDLEDKLTFANDEVTRLSGIIFNLTDENVKLALERSQEKQQQQVDSVFNQSAETADENRESVIKMFNSQPSYYSEEMRLMNVATNLTEQNAKLAKENLVLLSDAKDVRANSQEAQNEIQRLKEQVENFNLAIETTKKEREYVVNELNHELSLAKSERDRLSSTVSCLTEENTKLLAKCTELSESLTNSTNSVLTDSEEHKKEILEFEQEVKTLSERIAGLNQKIVEKADELFASETSLSNATEERDRLKTELETLSLRTEQDNAASTEKMSGIEKKLAQSEKELSIMKICMKDFNEIIEEKESELDAVKSKLEETEALLAASEKEKVEVESNLNQSKHCLATILETSGDENKFEAIQSQLNNRIEEVTALETKVKSLDALLETKSKESTEMTNELTRFTDMVKSYEAKEMDEFVILEEKALLEEEMSSLKGQLDSHVAEIKEKEKQLSDKTSSLKEIEQQLNTKNSELLRMQTDYEEKLADLEMKNTELSCKVSEEVRAKNALRSDCDELMNSLQRKERAMKGKEEEQHTLVQLEEQLQARDKDVAEKISELQECVAHIERMDDEQKSLQATIGQMSSQIAELQSEILSLSQERDEYSERVSTLTSQVESMNNVKAQNDLKTNEIETMKEEITILVQEIAKNEALSAEADGLKSKLQSITEERDSLNSKLQTLVQREAELSTKLSSVSNDLEGKTSLMEEFQSMSKELSEAKQLVLEKSDELKKAEENIKELKSSKDAFSKRRKLLEDQIEELQKSNLEYEMMKTGYIQLKSEFDTLQTKLKLADASKKEVEKDLSEYQHYHESTLNSEKVKYQQLTEKHDQIAEDLRTTSERLKQEMVDQERELSTQIATLSSDRNNLALQVKEFSAKLTSVNREVTNLTSNKDSLTAKLKEESERCIKLESKKIDDDKAYLEMYNKHQAMCTEADAIEAKYNQLDTNFQNLKESLEKEIIRRKYVEGVAKVIPKTYNPTTLEDFMRGLDTDHTAYLNRIKNTYKDVGLVCQVCDKRRKIDPNSPRYLPRPPPEAASSAAAAPGDKMDHSVKSQPNVSIDNKAAAGSSTISPDLENAPPRDQANTATVSPEVQKAQLLSPPQRKVALKKRESSEAECKQQ